MKIAFLYHTHEVSKELVRNIRSLSNQGHYVFLLVNDANGRKEAYYELSTSPTVHVEQEVEFANSGDLSLPRYYLLMMRKGLENPNIKYFVTIHPHMAPLKTNTYIEEFLTKHYPSNFYKVFEQPIDAKYIQRYFPYTNIKSFATSKFTQNWSKATASLLNLVGIRRKPIEKPLVASQYYMISDQGARDLVANIEYLLDNFKLSWFPEQIAIPTMLDKFATQMHINNNYILSNQTCPFTIPTVIDFNPMDFNSEQLFGGPFDYGTIKELLAHYRDQEV